MLLPDGFAQNPRLFFTTSTKAFVIVLIERPLVAEITNLPLKVFSMDALDAIVNFEGGIK